MATPHVAGVAALLRQKFPNSTVEELKSRMMNTSIPLDVEDGVRYPLSRQGAGRVDVIRAIESDVSFAPQSVSLGHVNIVEKKSVAFKFTLKNEGYEVLNLNLGTEAISSEWTLTVPRSVSIPPQEEITVHGSALIEPRFNAEQRQELDAYVIVYQDNVVKNQIPVHALRHRSSGLKVENFSIAASSSQDAVGAEGTFTVRNSGGIAGEAYPFNLLANDPRQDSNGSYTDRSFCDLQAAGYRIVESFATGTPKTYLEIAFKLYSPLTDWFFCEASALIDVDNDQVADYEVFGGRTESYTSDFDIPAGEFSILVDAKKMKQIRKDFDSTYTPGAFLDFGDAIIDFQPVTTFNFSTFAIVRVDLEAIPSNWQEMSIKAGILDNSRGSKSDDFIEGYVPVFVDPFEATFFDFDSRIQVGPYDYEMSRITQGVSEGGLMMVYPQNAGSLSISRPDQQSEMVYPEYRF